METPARVSQGRAAPIPQDLFDSAAIGMAVVDRASGRFLRANPALRALLGREEMELRGLTPCELIHPDDRAGWDEGLRLLRREPGETWRGEWRWLGPRGSVVWALVTATSAGNGFLVQVQDVSERRHAREARRRTEERLASVLFQAPVGLSVLEPDGTIALARGAAHPAHGARIEETVGRAVFDVYDVPEAVDSARRALAGEAVRATFAVGEDAYDVQFQPLRDDRGATAGAVVVATDVSDRERALAQLRERAAMGEAAARLGQRALDGLELDQVTFEAVAAVSDVLDVPHVGLLDLAAEDRSLRLGSGWAGSRTSWASCAWRPTSRARPSPMPSPPGAPPCSSSPARTTRGSGRACSTPTAWRRAWPPRWGTRSTRSASSWPGRVGRAPSRRRKSRSCRRWRT